MKQLLKKMLRRAFTAGFDMSPLTRQAARIPLHPVDKGTQILLTLQYQELVRRGATLPSFREVGFRSYSQNSEDGILLYIFALIGTTNRKVVEICAGDGIECNTANLIINHHCRGLLFDGNPINIETGSAFYRGHPDTFLLPPIMKHAWITIENINPLIRDNGFSGAVDLLSLDIDGMDYWVWKAIECMEPRVVVLEHNSPWGAQRAVTIPYKPDFVATYQLGVPGYYGATLPAFVKLARSKGYRLVGVEALGFNAFFVRNEVGEDVLPEVKAETCFSTEPVSEAERVAYMAQLRSLETREYIEV